METAVTEQVEAPAVETKDAAEQRVGDLSAQPEAEETVDAVSEVESGELAKEDDASEVAGVVDSMVSGVVAASEQDGVASAEDDGSLVGGEENAEGGLAGAEESEAAGLDDASEAAASEEKVSASAQDEARASATATLTETTETTETTEAETSTVKTTVTGSTITTTKDVFVEKIVSTEAVGVSTEEVEAGEAVVEEVAVEHAVVEEKAVVEDEAIEEELAVNNVAGENAEVEEAGAEEAVIEDAAIEETAVEEAVVEQAVVEAVNEVLVEEAAIEDAATQNAVIEEAVTEQLASDNAGEEASAVAEVIDDVVTETATTEEVVVERAVVEEEAVDVVAVSVSAATKDSAIKTQESKGIAAIESTPSVDDAILSREVADGIVDTIVDEVVAKAITVADEAAEAAVLASRTAVVSSAESAFVEETVASVQASEEITQGSGEAAGQGATEVDSVAIETKANASPERQSETSELATVSLDDDPKDNAAARASSHSLSSDEEGWRSDDNDSVDGGDTSTKKKSRALRSPVRSMISRFASKVSSSMPKKRPSAHRTESAAMLELVTPSPVKGVVSHLETHQETTVKTHRTDSASKLELAGNSPVKNIVHRFESPHHNSLDGLKIRTVRTFFDEKERSIHVEDEKDKYDSVLKSAGDVNATPKKPSPPVAKTASPVSKPGEDSARADSASPASSTPVKRTSDTSAESNASIDTTTATPVKNMVSRFEKKPEQSLDNLSFRTVRTFFPTNAEPSIRVGVEKQKYDALTEQQTAEVPRQEEEKLAKKKALESAATSTEAAAAVSSEDEHTVHVRDIAHQMEARSSLAPSLAPVSLSRSSSGTSERVDTTPVRITRGSSGTYEAVDMAPVRLGRSSSSSSDRSSVGGAAVPPSLSRSTSASSDRPPRFVARSQSDASSHSGETHEASDEFHVKDVAQRFEARLTPSPQAGSARVRRSSGAEGTLAAAHSTLRRTSEPPAKQPFTAPGVDASREEKSEEEVFRVKDIAHRFEAKQQQSPVAGSLSRQSSGVDAAASATAATPPLFRRNSSQGSAASTPAKAISDPETPKQVQITSNAILETTPSANVRDIAHRFETNRAQSVETPAYRTMETFFNEVEEPSVRVRAEKAKLEALEKQKEQEAKLAWAKTLHAEEARKTETLDWFLMPAATNPALVRLHAVLSDRDPVTSLAIFPRLHDLEEVEADSGLTVPVIPMDLPPFA